MTDPAAEELGCRVFEVEISPGHRLQFIVTHEARDECPGEIHSSESESFLTIEKPVTNAQLTQGLRAVLSQASLSPGHTTSLVTA